MKNTRIGYIIIYIVSVEKPRCTDGMMPFKEAQTNALEAKLSAKHVKSISRGGSAFSYVEGWHVISEANRVFGLAGWDRETVSTECIWQNKSQHQNVSAYVARVRISVRAGDQIVIREGTGAGHGVGGTLV